MCGLIASFVVILGSWVESSELCNVMSWAVSSFLLSLLQGEPCWLWAGCWAGLSKRGAGEGLA